jgi:hypothetical protein
MTHRKPHLPQKTCVVCGRPFAWRQKWRDDFDQVKYCSEGCRRRRRGVAKEGRDAVPQR